MFNINRRLILATLAILGHCPAVPAAERKDEWNKKAAASYLDHREKTWLEFPNAARGEGDTRTTCISCHTVVGYAFARPVLRRLDGAMPPTQLEQKLLGDRKKRVEHWSDLDSMQWKLSYDFDDKKKKESWGTEAVLNALVFALDDRYNGRQSTSPVTRQAFANLWQIQLRDGQQKGSWDWLDFNYEPWESASARYFGASLAAIAVTTAPGYYTPADADLQANVHSLRGFLKDNYAGQNLFNRTWALWASTQLNDVLTASEQEATPPALRQTGGTTAAGACHRSATRAAR